MKNAAVSFSAAEINMNVGKFIEDNTLIIISAARKAMLDEYYYGELINNMAVKFFNGKLEHDKAKGKYSTFIYSVAYRAAVDLCRKNSRWRNAESIDTSYAEQKYDTCSYPMNRLDYEDGETIQKEVFRRIMKRHHVGFSAIRIFRLYMFHGKKVSELAEKYHLDQKRTAVAFSRLKTIYQKTLKEVRAEEDNGTLKLTFLTDKDMDCGAVAA